MPIRSLLILPLALLLLLPTGRQAEAGDFEKAAPWDRVRHAEEGVEVRVEGNWYALISIEGKKTEDVLAFCKQRYGPRWKKRFGEDLVEVLAGMSVPPRAKVDLVLRDAAGKELTKSGVPMTRANRQEVWKAANRGPRASGASPAVRRVTRDHAETPDPRFVRLVYRMKLDGPVFETALDPKQAMQDLDQLEWHIANEHSYADMHGVDYRAALDTIRLGLGEGISKGDLALQLQRVICLFGDGHARIRGLSGEILGRRALDAAFAAFGEQVLLAAREPRDGPAPYRVVAIDGMGIEKYLGAIDDLVPRGSDAYRARRRARDLRYLPYLRACLGLAPATHAVLQLQSADGRRNATTRASIGASRMSPPPPIAWERKRDVGYLRIAEMSGDRPDLEQIDRALQAFKDTKGLVIDVRGNGGGSRDILRALFPYFMRKGEMHVANVAAYRLPPGVKQGAPEGYLANRFLYPRTSALWNAAERKHVTDALASFVPDWTPAADRFSAWHAMLLTPETNPKAYRYHERVVVLMDGGCFSATDIFLGAFKGWRGVTLMGTPSGGGSGRSKRGQLANSGIRFRLSTMASFRPTGARYDGKGIQPDVIVEPEPADIGTEQDSVLARALATAAKPIK